MCLKFEFFWNTVFSVHFSVWLTRSRKSKILQISGVLVGGMCTAWYSLKNCKLIISNYFILSLAFIVVRDWLEYIHERYEKTNVWEPLFSGLSSPRTRGVYYGYKSYTCTNTCVTYLPISWRNLKNLFPNKCYVLRKNC